MPTKSINSYIAVEPKYGTAMYSGYAESEGRFIELCASAQFDLEDLDVLLVHKNCKNELGHSIQEGVSKDLATL